MDQSLNSRVAQLDVLVGDWELKSTSGWQTMNTARTSFRWLGERRFLIQRTDPPTYLAPEWQGAAPQWVHAVIGFDDYSDRFTMLYADSRGVCRSYSMELDGNRSTLSGRPGADFHQRFDATLSEDHNTIGGRWEASDDGQSWTTDFDVTFGA